MKNNKQDICDIDKILLKGHLENYRDGRYKVEHYYEFYSYNGGFYIIKYQFIKNYI